MTLVLKIETIFADVATVRARIDAFLDGLGLAAARRPHIVLLHDRLSDAEMPALFRACDAYVSPTRGEGWGRPLMEALALRATGHHLAVERPAGVLGRHQRVARRRPLIPVPDDVDIPVFRGGRWFDPDVDALRAAMRAVADDPAAARATALAAGGPLCARFSRAAIAERAAELILEAL